ncbi:MAG: hypothetical protein C4297_08155 [Gemmataceae bacterium]
MPKQSLPPSRTLQEDAPPRFRIGTLQALHAVHHDPRRVRRGLYPRHNPKKLPALPRFCERPEQNQLASSKGSDDRGAPHSRWHGV